MVKRMGVTQEANTVIAEDLEMLINDFNKRFCNLKTIDFLLVDSTTVSRFTCCIRAIPELCELHNTQQDESKKTLFKIKE